MSSRRTAPSSPPRTRNNQNDHSPPKNTSRSPGLRTREPPPTLFLHPSPAASHVSLQGFAPSATPGHSGSTAAHALNSGPSGLGAGAGAGKPNIAASLAPGVTPGRVPFRTADSSRSADRTDALWAEMQATLEEVEVSASGGTTIFGHEHDHKLEQLRAAQIALAQAWARSEADDAIETREGASTVAGGGAGTAAGGGGAGAMSGVTGDEMRPLAKSVGGDQAGPDMRSTTGGTTSIPRPGSSGRTAEKLGARLEEETKADILLARRRREANDQYFERVSGGVLDVIAKLEEVAKAMTAVEQESKSVWNDDDSTGNARH